MTTEASPTYEEIEQRCRNRGIDIKQEDFGSFRAAELDQLFEWDGKGDIPEFLQQWPTIEVDEEPDELETLKGQLDRLQRHRQRANELAREVDHAKAEWEDAKEVAKECKTTYEAALSKLHAHVKSDPDQGTLPFPSDDPPEATASDDWGREPISVLSDHGLTENQCEKLDAARIETVRELREFIAKDAHWYRKIKGVGEGTVDKITDALNSYQQTNPEQADEADECDVLDREDASAMLEQIIDDCVKVPDAGREFADSVESDADDMHSNIVDHQSVTAEQSRAIRNWRRGLDGWLNAEG